MQLAESLSRVLSASEVFGELFYEEFFRRCPEAKVHFEHADMRRQALVVTMTLTSVQQYNDGGYPAVERYLEHLGGMHRRRAIPMETYPHFRAAMIHTLAKMLSDVWSKELRAAWELALDKTLRVMLDGYGKPPGV